MTCTQEEADQWLLEDVQRVVDAINADITISIDQDEFDALDFGFNLGIHNLESSTLWKLLNEGDFEGAAAQFPRWDRAGGREIGGLLRRRLEEQQVFKKGMQQI